MYPLRNRMLSANRLLNSGTIRRTLNSRPEAVKLTARHSHTGSNQKHHTNPGPIDSFSAATHTVGERNFSSDIVLQRLKASILDQFPREEIKKRVELAAAYRLFGYYDWNEAIFNHLTSEIVEPDGKKHFLINPYGLRYDEITASSLIKIDVDGNIVHPGVVGDIFGVNRAGFVIHAAVHKARGDTAGAIMHSHHTSSTGIACTKDAFIPELSQTAELLGPVAYHDFHGLVTDLEEQQKLASSIGDKNIMFFRNHGILTAGPTIAAAWYWMYNLIRACQIQVAAHSSTMGDPNKLLIPSKEIAHNTYERIKGFSDVGCGELEFAAYMRLMDKVDASYRL